MHRFIHRRAITGAGRRAARAVHGAGQHRLRPERVPAREREGHEGAAKGPSRSSGSQGSQGPGWSSRFSGSGWFSGSSEEGAPIRGEAARESIGLCTSRARQSSWW